MNNVEATFIICGAISLAVAALGWVAAKKYGRSV